MQNMGLLMEYEDILLKKRKDFSATYIGQNASQKDIKELFQYVFENLLEWTPEMARDYLTMDIIQKLHLMRPLMPSLFLRVSLSSLLYFTIYFPHSTQSL